ncbi:MAG: hypothetical protein AB1Z98_14050 [Nannocystaceae bacterium]
MKNFKTNKPLPKLSTRTLDQDDLASVVGGRAAADCTCNTWSVCHIDGTTDADGAAEVQMY